MCSVKNRKPELWGKPRAAVKRKNWVATAGWPSREDSHPTSGGTYSANSTRNKERYLRVHLGGGGGFALEKKLFHWSGAGFKRNSRGEGLRPGVGVMGRLPGGDKAAHPVSVKANQRFRSERTKSVRRYTEETRRAQGVHQRAKNNGSGG